MPRTYIDHICPLPGMGFSVREYRNDGDKGGCCGRGKGGVKV